MASAERLEKQSMGWLLFFFVISVLWIGATIDGLEQGNAVVDPWWSITGPLWLALGFQIFFTSGLAKASRRGFRVALRISFALACVTVFVSLVTMRLLGDISASWTIVFLPLFILEGTAFFYFLTTAIRSPIGSHRE